MEGFGFFKFKTLTLETEKQQEVIREISGEICESLGQRFLFLEVIEMISAFISGKFIKGIISVSNYIIVYLFVFSDSVELLKFNKSGIN